MDSNLSKYDTENLVLLSKRIFVCLFFFFFFVFVFFVLFFFVCFFFFFFFFLFCLFFFNSGKKTFINSLTFLNKELL